VYSHGLALGEWDPNSFVVVEYSDRNIVHQEYYSPRVPDDGVSVESCRWIKPELELLFLVSFPLGIHIRVYSVWFPRRISQELEIDLVVPFSLRGQEKKW
jgi:hypothetical protein